MHTGKVKKVIKDRGFGFIDDTDGREVFFHKSSVLDGKFDSIDEQQAVEFDIENSPKGPRAVNIRVV